MVAGGREEALVGRDAESVDLGVGVLDGARTNAREGFPEPVGVLAGAQDHAHARGLGMSANRMVWSYPAER